jgi:hypothetical protein
MSAGRQSSFAKDAIPRKSLRRALYAIAWALLIFLALRFIVRFVFPYLTLKESAFGRFWPRRAYLLPHIVAGSIALLSGPFQFGRGFDAAPSAYIAGQVACI